jgi:serine/threonine protein kinase
MHLGHPNIARIYDANILPIPYVEMEYLPRTLADLPRPVPPGESVRLVAGILSAVAYAHAQGIVHRDLKPRNILLAPDGTPKVADWGLSRTRLAREEVTLVGYSRRYAAPEQLAGHAETGTDERTDVFQAGIILYELLTGRPPFAGEDYEQPPVLPSSVHPALARFDPIIRKCLDPDPARRYQTAGEFRRALSGPG